MRVIQPSRKWFKVKLGLWWVQRVAFFIAGLTWLMEAANIAFGDGSLTEFEQVLGAVLAGFWLMSDSGWKKPT